MSTPFTSLLTCHPRDISTHYKRNTLPSEHRTNSRKARTTHARAPNWARPPTKFFSKFGSASEKTHTSDEIVSSLQRCGSTGRVTARHLPTEDSLLWGSSVGGGAGSAARRRVGPTGQCVPSWPARDVLGGWPTRNRGPTPKMTQAVTRSPSTWKMRLRMPKWLVMMVWLV